MKKTQFLALYLLYLIPFTAGTAMLPFLPIYFERLGVSASFTGYYLAMSFGSLAAGTIATGWLTERFGRRKLIIFSSILLAAGGLAAIGLVTDLWLLTAATCVSFFAGGLIVTSAFILTGLLAPPERRGQTFGLLATGVSVAAILGGAYSGRVIELWGFQGFFLVTGGLYLLLIPTLFILEDTPAIKRSTREASVPAIPLGWVFWLLFAGSVLVHTANFSSIMIRPILMNALAFRMEAIGDMTTITGFFTLPLPYLVGWLSDRIGRSLIIVSIFIAIAIASFMLIFATDLWHFWLSNILGGMLGTGFAVASALLTDIVEPQALDSALSRFSSSQWFGGVIGYLVTGMALDNLGLDGTVMASVMLCLIGAALVGTSLRRNALRNVRP